MYLLFYIDLKKLLIQISNDWKNTTIEEQKLMWTNAKMTKFIALASFFTASGSVVTYGIVFLVNDYYKAMQEGTNAMTGHFLKGYFPFESYYSPVYEIICFCQFTGALLSTLAFSSFDTLFICSILHFTARICNLRQRIPHLVENHYHKKIRFPTVLKSVVHEHQHLIR